MNKRVSTAAVFLFLIVIAMILVDFGVSNLPVQAGDERWRIGLFGSAANVLPLTLLTLLVGLAGASLLESLGWNRAVAVLSGLAALGFLIGLPLFILDVLQVQGQVQPSANRPFLRLLATTGTKGALGTLGLGTIAWLAFSRSRELAGSPKDPGRSRTSGSPLVTARADEDATPSNEEDE